VEAAIKIWEDAIGRPGEVSHHNLIFREALSGENSRPMYCFNGYESPSDPGDWNDELPTGTLAIHAPGVGSSAATSGYIPKADDRTDEPGRNLMYVGPETRMDNVWIIAHEASQTRLSFNV
jgi:hypothetical protein